MNSPRILTKSIATLLLLGAVGLGPSLPSSRAANIWDGGGTTDFWTDVLNWDDDAFPTYGTLTFAGALRTTNIVDVNISMNQLLWTGTSAWTLNNANGAVISLFDNGGAQAKVENQSTGLVTINAPITFAATTGNNWGEINAVGGGLTFGGDTLTVNGSGVNGIRMFGGQATIFNNTVSASGKYFATTAAGAKTVEIGGTFTSGDFYLMNGSTLKLNSGGNLTTSGLRLGGDFGTTGTQNLTLGATFQLTSLTGGQTFASNINSVTGNTSNALVVSSLNTSGTNTLSGSIFLDSPLNFQLATGGTLAVTGVISNASGFTKNGMGATASNMIVSGTNTFTGPVTVNSGSLTITNSSALGVGPKTITVNNGTAGDSQLHLDGSGGSIALASNLTFNTSNATSGAIINDAGTNTINGPINLTAGGGNTLIVSTAGTLTLAGNITATTTGRGLNLRGAGNGIISGVISDGSTAGLPVFKDGGAGTWTLSGANTYTGGLTLSAGGLSFNNAAAAGNTATGAVTITGGTLDNTSGAAITTSAAKALNINGDFTFTGTNNLSVNLGTATIGGAIGTRTVNIAGGTLAVGLLNSGAGIGLTKTGNGTLAMGNAALANTSTINGILDVQAGKVQINSDFLVQGLSGAGTVENGGAVSKWFRSNQNVDTTFSGTLSDGPNPATVRLGFEKRGTGTLNLTGASNTTSDRFAIENGTVRITGTYNTGFAAGALNQIASIGNIANQNGQLIVDGGTFNALRNAQPSMAVGAGASTRGFVRMTSGTINTANQFNLGNGSGATTTRAFAAYTQSGGTLNSGSWLVVGGNFDRAVLNQSGGIINVLANRMTVGAGGVESLGVVNLSGGTFNVAAGGNTGIFLGENGFGNMTVSGTAAVNLNTNGSANSGTFVFGNQSTSTGANLNLNGGTLTTLGVVKGTSAAGAVYRLNFNGGTLRANASNATFLPVLANTTAYINPGGATIDSNGFNITAAQPLLAPTGNGVSNIAVTTGGVGYLDTPVVTLAGGSGTGATAIANVSGGVVTGFTITNPGVGYAPADVLTATIFGGGATTAATAGTISLAANGTTGGVTKTGAGTLTIGSTTSTYGGLTTISGGTLSIGSLANGGVASRLGASPNAAANLVLDGGALQYTGATASSDRGFTITAGKTGIFDVTTAATVLTLSGATAATTGALTKVGSGTLSLTGPVNYTGATTINAGILGIGGTAAGGVTVNTGGRLNAIHNAVGALTTPTLTLGTGSGLDFDFGALATLNTGHDIITIGNASGLTLGTTSLNLYQAGGILPFTTNGTFTLLDYTTSYIGSLLGAFSVANSQPGKIYSIADNLAATTIELSIGDSISTTWNVDGGGSWNVAGNWTAGIPNSIGATATFGSVLTPPNAPATVTVDGPKTVGNIVFSNANTYNITGGAADALTLDNGLGTATISATAPAGSHSVNAPIFLVNPSAFNAVTGAILTIGGDVSGSAGVTKTGDGIVSLAGTNSFTTTTVNIGTLQVGNGGATGTLGSGAATVASGATLAFNRNNAASFANNISGAGGNVNQIGSGTTTYTGSATHTGATNVTAGTFINEGTINGTTALNVNGGTATLQAASNTTVAGPTSVGSTANGALNVLGGANANLNGLVGIGTGATFTGGLTVNTTGTVATNSIVNVGVGAGANGAFTMTAGTFNQTGAANIAIGANGGSGTYTQTGGALTTGNTNPGFGIAVGTEGSTGSANLSGGSITTPGEFWIGNNNGAGASPANVGSMTMSAGAITTGSWFVVGRNTATGTLNLDGGTITKNGAGSFIIIGSLGGTGTLTQTGGALNATAGGIRLGENAGTTPALNALWDMQGGTSNVTGEINVAWRSSQATWNVSGSSLVNASGRLIVAADNNSAAVNAGAVVNGNPVGTVNISGGAVTFAGTTTSAPTGGSATGDNRIGGDASAALGANAQGTVNVSGTGALNFGSNLQIGAFGKGFMNISGSGVVNATAGFASVGRFAGSVGELNVNGGTFAQTNAGTLLIIGEDGAGTLNLNSGTVNVTGGLRLGQNTTGNGTVNLNGGTLSTPNVLKTAAGSTATWNFNGGTLKTTADSTDFLQNIPAASISVANGGAIVDTDGHLVTLTQGLAPAPASTGGLTKNGLGTLTLSGASTFTGPTNVNNGTLAISGSILGSTAVAVNTGGTLLLSNAGDHILDTAPMTLAGGTFNTGGLSETLGTLTLTESSTIDFGLGASILSFADSTGLWTSGKTLSIWNWSGTPVEGGGADQLRFASNGLDTNQLAQINFFSDSGMTQLSITPQYPANGFVAFGEVTPVPEPSSIATVLGLLGLAGWRERRKARLALAAGRRA